MLICKQCDCTSTAVLNVPRRGFLRPYSWAEQEGSGLIKHKPINDLAEPRTLAIRFPSNERAIAFDQPEFSWLLGKHTAEYCTIAENG